MANETYKKPLKDLKEDLSKKGKKNLASFVGKNPGLVVNLYRLDFDRMLDYRKKAKNALKAGKRAEAERYAGYYAKKVQVVENRLVMSLGKAVMKSAAKKPKKKARARS